MNKLVLGTAQLGLNYGVNNFQKKPSMNSSVKILNEAFSQGIRCLDTAESYGDAHSVIGEYHSLNPDKKFLIYDKISYIDKKKLQDFEKNIDDKLLKLNIDYLQGLMFHSASLFEQNEKLYSKMIELKKRGKIKKIGVSVYKNNEIINILNKGYAFDFIQIPFNVLDNEFQKKIVIEKMIKSNIEIHARSIFLQGIFYMDFDTFPEKLEPLKKYILAVKEICKENDCNIDDMLINYPKQKKYIKKIIFGIDNISQLEKNLNTYNKKSDISLDIVDKIKVKERDLLNPSLW